MNNDKGIRDILEPEAPRLSSAASARIETAVEHALTSTHNRRWSWRRPGIMVPAVAVPALALIIALLLINPFNSEVAPKLMLLSEEQLLANLEEIVDTDIDLDGVYFEDSVNLETENWTDDDWNAFTADLESFQLSDKGEKR